MSDRQAHFEAAGFAGLKVEEAQQAIAAAMPIGEEALALIHNATGDTPMESAHNAQSMMAEVNERLLELVGICENIKAELQRYAGGF